MMSVKFEFGNLMRTWYEYHILFSFF